MKSTSMSFFILKGKKFVNYWIWLASIKMLGSIKKQRLLEHFKTPENIYNATKSEILKIDGIGEKICNNIITSKDKDLIEKIEGYMLKNDIKLINITESKYPDKLRKIYDPPMTLFYKGDLALLNKKSIAVVGSRNATNYGIKTAFKIGKEVSENGRVVISGLARGIDTWAHKGALTNFGGTIAVIGSGLDYIYPSENYLLYKEISQKGLLLSEFVVGTKPIPGNFPARNRIVSGISDAIIVVEASEKSGALITVDFALDEGKSVYAVPGNIDSNQSKGTNELIKNGANIYTSINDLEL